MATTKSMRVDFRPCHHGNGFYTTAFWLFGDNPGHHRLEVEVQTVEQLKDWIYDQVQQLELPERPADGIGGRDDREPLNAWSVTCSPVSGRWAPGFKKAFERPLHFDVEEVLTQ